MAPAPLEPEFDVAPELGALGAGVFTVVLLLDEAGALGAGLVIVVELLLELGGVTMVVDGLGCACGAVTLMLDGVAGVLLLYTTKPITIAAITTISTMTMVPHPALFVLLSVWLTLMFP